MRVRWNAADGGTAFASRAERLGDLLQSWKRAQREMQRCSDPAADMVAADIEKLAEAMAQDPTATHSAPGQRVVE